MAVVQRLSQHLQLSHLDGKQEQSMYYCYVAPDLELSVTFHLFSIWTFVHKLVRNLA